MLFMIPPQRLFPIGLLLSAAVGTERLLKRELGARQQFSEKRMKKVKCFHCKNFFAGRLNVHRGMNMLIKQFQQKYVEQIVRTRCCTFLPACLEAMAYIKSHVDFFLRKALYMKALFLTKRVQTCSLASFGSVPERYFLSYSCLLSNLVAPRCYFPLNYGDDYYAEICNSNTTNCHFPLAKERMSSQQNCPDYSHQALQAQQ